MIYLWIVIDLSVTRPEATGICSPNLFCQKSEATTYLNRGWYLIAVLCILLLPPLDCSICQAPGLRQPPSEHQCAVY